MNRLIQDIGYALRQLRKSPGFTITAVLTLALGIGANTAIFTLVHSVLLRNLPVADPKALWRLGNTDTCCLQSGLTPNDDYSMFSWELYKHLQANTPEFEQLAAMQSYPWKMTVLGNKPGMLAQGVPASFVSGNYFQTFGLMPFAGRLLTPSDDVPGAPPVAVISYQAWQREFGGETSSDTSIVGSVFQFKTYPVTIVGIAPPGFYGERMIEWPANFYLPFSLEPVFDGEAALLHSKGLSWVYVIGRVKAGTPIAPLQEKVSVNLRQWFGENLDMFKVAEVKKHLDASRVVLTPGGAGIANMQDQYRSGLYLLLTISGLVLLIACANLANLVLVRSIARAAETSLRMALGAQRLRILQQMLTESLVLATIGGVTGLAVAYGGTKMLLSLAFPDSPNLPIHANPSLPVFAFAFVLTLITGVVFGLAPAWITARAQPADALRGSNRATSGNASLLQRSLVILQASLSLVLLVGAGLLSKSLSKLEHQDFGFQTENRIVMHIDPESAGYKPEQLQGLDDEITSRFHAIPGVQQVGLGGYSPLEGDSWGQGVWVQGHPDPGVDEDNSARWLRASPEFLSLIGQQLLRGRYISTQDTASAPGVAVVNETFVKKFFKPDEDPIGAHFGTSKAESKGDFEIIGVVKDAKWSDPREVANPMYFRPLLQAAASQKDGEIRSFHMGTIMLHTSAPIVGLESQARRILASINPNLPVTYYSTFEDQIAGQFTQERLIARLTILFSGLALLLAAIGLYGVTAYVVARRTSEIGIRMALGATRGSVVSRVLRQAMVQAGIGLLIGIPVALLCARFMKEQLYHVGGFDLLVIAFAVFALALSACVAGLIPARRAAGIDPMNALRTE